MRRFFADLDFGRYIDLLRGPNGINKYVPPAFHPFTNDLLKFGPLKANLGIVNQVIAAPSNDMMNRTAKLWRGALCFAVAEGLGGTAEEMLPLAVSLEVLHGASLVIDDVEDRSQMRRGKPCIHLLHGEPTAISVGNYMFFLPLTVISNSSFSDEIKLKLLGAATQEIVKLTVGQGLDIRWATKQITPSIEDYLFMIECKTSVIVRLAVKLASIAHNADHTVSDQLVCYAENLGAAFQIKDDLLNLESEEYAKGRSYLGEDITEGKRSAIIIRAVKQSSQSSRLIEILNMKTSDLSLVNEALQIIKTTDALSWSNELAEKHICRALMSLKKCDLLEEPRTFLEQLATFMVDRSK